MKKILLKFANDLNGPEKDKFIEGWVKNNSTFIRECLEKEEGFWLQPTGATPMTEEEKIKLYSDLFIK